ncbi:MAG: TIM barrel protein [Chloroflexi bacterium]|jgi:sugar phosphate isomerase/epimerase|nr:TIM barrel protein [Chloroflexota bacterium]
MRLGAPLFREYHDPAAWVQALQEKGYRAAYAPVGLDADDVTVQAYALAAKQANITISEVGAWSNPLSPSEDIRNAAIERCQRSLDLAERLGARCAVNISGSLGELWDGHHPLNLTEETLDMIVQVTRQIIDAVKPRRAFYTLETMPWMYPDSTDSYVQLLRAIDRPAFAVHFDPVNLICSPQRYYANGALMTEFVDKLGPYIKSCHAKDILLADRLTTHLDEVRAGLGNLDYRTFLRQLNRLEPDLPLMLEHLPTEQDYDLAAAYVRQVAAQEGVNL